jgi:hypothetical protein
VLPSSSRNVDFILLGVSQYVEASTPLALLGAVAFAVPTASANVIFTIGNNPQPNEENILFHTPETGTSITGQTQSNHNVLFTNNGSSEILFQVAQGQADIEYAADPGKANLTQLDITVPGFTFGDFIMNPFNGIGNEAVTAIDNFN